VSIDPRDIAPSTDQGLLDARLQDDAAGTGPPADDGGTTERRRRATAIETALAIRGRRQWAPPKQAKPGAPLLDVQDLKTYFRLESGTVRAVDGVSFRLDYGEALGIVGESGCGKTTTALSLVQILPSNARIAGGEINLMGIDLVKKNENQLRRYRWREISIVFQGAMNALNPVQRVIDQIAEPIEQRLGESRAR
jgi:ABC-type multidrug transport system fused ATPase/permease subunit